MGTSPLLTARLAFNNTTSHRSNSYSNRNHYTQHQQQPRPLYPSTNTIVLDWDDTLMCTSYYIKRNKQLTSSEREQYMKLGSIVTNFLTLCISKGDVYIITNSTVGWLLSTAEHVLRMNLDVFNDINIISTREMYESFPNISMDEWKLKAFEELNGVVRNSKCLVAIGDNNNDVKGAMKYKGVYDGLIVSTGKFVEKPRNVEELINEIKVMANMFDKLIKKECSVWFNEEGVVIEEEEVDESEKKE